VQLVYNFLEQGNWAVKTGLIRNKRRKEFINRWANYTELLTYVFSVQLAGLGLRECSRQVEEAEGELRRRNARKKDDGDGDGDGDEDGDGDGDGDGARGGRGVAGAGGGGGDRGGTTEGASGSGGSGGSGGGGGEIVPTTEGAPPRSGRLSRLSSFHRTAVVGGLYKLNPFDP
jgi:hypothetical protein